MHRTGFLLLLMSLLLSGCGIHHRTAVDISKVHVLKPIRHVKLVKQPLGAFNRVIVEGRLDVSIHSGYKQPMVILRGDPRDLQQVTIGSNGETLTVSLGNGYPKCGPVKAEIRTRALNYLEYNGAGRLTGTKLRSNDLTLHLNNSGYTHLDGYLRLRELIVRGNGLYRIGGVHSAHLLVDIDENATVEMTGKTYLNDVILHGNGRFSLYWIQGPYLKLHAYGNSMVKLAGVIGKLNIELYDSAVFEGRYLRADVVFVKTFNQSIARISAVKRQHTLASDHSDIYFYNLAEMRTDFMAYDGSVLDMRSWDLRGRKEYTRLNKWL